MFATSQNVADVMTRAVVAVGRNAPFKEVASLLRRWHVSALPVVEGDNRVIGVVSEADLLPKEEFRDRAPGHLEQSRRLDDLGKAGALTAEDVMTTPAVCTRTDATLAEAARIMAQKRVKRLPVIDAEGRLTGIVSRGDLLTVYLRPDAEIEDEIRYEVVAPLFPYERPTVQVRVEDGVATLTGDLRDSLVPVAERMTRSVDGVVDVRMEVIQEV
jgi:CBS domain-containing protein